MKPYKILRKNLKPSAKGMTKTFERLDAFGEPLPSFNIKGKTRVHSLTGGLCTLILIFVILSYASVKFEHLITRHSPIMSSYPKDLILDEKISLSQRNFRMAFAIENYYPPLFLKKNTKYIKWVFRKYGKKDNESFEEILPSHDCTEDDYKEFYPADRKAALLVENIKADPDRGFLCLDWDDVDIEIYGSENESDY